MIDMCLPSEKIASQIKSQRKILYITPPYCNTNALLKFTINNFGQPQKIIWEAYKI